LALDINTYIGMRALVIIVQKLGECKILTQ